MTIRPLGYPSQVDQYAQFAWWDSLPRSTQAFVRERLDLYREFPAAPRQTVLKALFLSVSPDNEGETLPEEPAA